MPKVGSSQFAVYLLDGYNLLAAKVQAIAWKVGVALQRSDGLGDSWHEHNPTGARTAGITQSGGFFDTTANGVHAALKNAPTTSRLLVFAPDGNTIGNLFIGAEGTFSTEYDPISSLNGLTKANATYEISGKLDEGVIVQDHVVKTVDWNTKTDGFPVDYTLDPSQTAIPITSNSLANPSVVTTPVPHGHVTGDIVLISGVATSNPTINGERTVTVLSATTFSVPVNVTTAGTGGSFVRANSAFGAVGHQQVSDFAGFTGFVGKIRDSTDNVTYADLITFANVTGAPAAERATVTGVIDRYVSYDGNVTGTGTIKPFAGLKRNSS